MKLPKVRLRKSTRLMIGVLGGSVAALGLALLASHQLTRPPPPPVPSVEEQGAPLPTGDPRCSPLHYSAVLDSTATSLHVPVPPIEQLRQPLRGGVELAEARTLKGKGGALETEHLRLQTSIAKLGATIDGTQGFRADHLVLSITNKSDKPLAYRVLTSLPNVHRCASKGDLPHNVIALGPRETVRRTECLYHNKQVLTVTRVDVYELTELGHRYVSRLQPTEGSPFDMRIARAHDRGELQACRVVPWRDLDAQADIWRTVIDFHARHDCDEYTLPKGYQPLTAAGTLPVCS